jgi:tRNA-splicing ligase RtcB
VRERARPEGASASCPETQNRGAIFRSASSSSTLPTERENSRVSLKYAVEKVSDNHYVLPKTGSMKVEAHAFLSEELYAASEEKVWKQIAHGASYEGVTGAYLMPDTHTGYGVPVGSVIVTDGTIIQGGSGYDISCGVLYMKADLGAGAVRSMHERQRWVQEVERRIATGVGHRRPDLMPRFTRDQVDDVLRFGAKAIGVGADRCERQFIPVPENIDLTKIDRAYRSVQGQLGSVGGGNHFVEMQCDRDTGEVFVMVHCGSRGYGWQTANHYFYEGARLRGLPSNRREDSWLYADEPLGGEYWAHHNSAANFAVANRHVIVDGIREATQEVFGADVEVYYEISHNLVQEETLVLPDGTTKKGFVHRKGATRAFPAGHPDLAGTRWEATGHPCLIPGSMYAGAAILFPMAGAFKSACSVNHGSGRLLARGEAKRKLEHKQQRIDDEMATVHRAFAGVTIEGIAHNHSHVPLDECGHVYKDLDAVLSVLEAEGIAKVTSRLYPVANIKGAD